MATMDSVCQYQTVTVVRIFQCCQRYFSKNKFLLCVEEGLNIKGSRAQEEFKFLTICSRDEEVFAAIMQVSFGS